MYIDPGNENICTLFASLYQYPRGMAVRKLESLLEVCSATDGHDAEGILRLVLLKERTAGPDKRTSATDLEYGVTNACIAATLTSASEGPGKISAILGKLCPRYSERSLDQY